MDAVDETGWVERVGLARPRRAAADIDGGDCVRLGQHDGDAGSGAAIFGVADADARDVGDEVARAGSANT